MANMEIFFGGGDLCITFNVHDLSKSFDKFRMQISTS
jgi:hypothetical protein